MNKDDCMYKRNGQCLYPSKLHRPTMCMYDTHEEEFCGVYKPLSETSKPMSTDEFNDILSKYDLSDERRKHMLETFEKYGSITWDNLFEILTATPDQTIKADAGKPKLTLVPQQIIFDIAKVREYGLKKYGTAESWKSVDIQRYRDATFRHFLAYLRDPQGVDEESGLPHLSHLACNISFLCELEKNNKEETK